jgi:hypothetical protein
MGKHAKPEPTPELGTGKPKNGNQGEQIPPPSPPTGKHRKK